jgi:hypothetical protein
VSRVGLGRHGQLDSEAGDPLDGLVNLFDVGLVLAVAFLIAGIALGTHRAALAARAKAATSATRTTLSTPKSKATASGRGQPVGQVYRLPDGRLVLVNPKGGAAAP